eukprot:1117898-Alexandrium_andersonii.AAC.1
MSASLVGSEMCIRDRPRCVRVHACIQASSAQDRTVRSEIGMNINTRRPVSYTHLTLPTICSV